MVGTFSPLTRVTGALVHVLAGLPVGGQLVAGLTHTLEAAVHVDTSTVLAHSSLGTLVHVSAKAAVGGVFKPILANTDIGARGVLAEALEADHRVLQALVHVDTAQPGLGQSVSRMTFTTERPVGICTFSV